jgi:hypothetical protein
MVKTDADIQEAHLLSYIIASSDMRYIQINEREVYLRHDPDLGLVIQGEVPGTGADLNANLSYMLLEFSMSCEDCQDRVMTAESAERFGEHLGQVFIDRLYQETPEVYTADQLARAFDIILNSMGVGFTKELTDEYLRYALAHSPLHEAAGKTGLVLQVAMAQRAFVAMCKSILHVMAMDWRLAQPIEPESEAPLLQVLLVTA